MSNDEALRKKGLGLDLAHGTLAPHGFGMTDDDIKVYRALIASLDSSSRDEVAKMRGSEAIHRIINKSVEDAGIVLHPDDPAWRQLELAFTKAQRKAVQAITARLEGEEIATPQLVPNAKSLPLTRALANWSHSNSRPARKPRQESINEAGRAVQRFVELQGDLDIGAISKIHAREFRDALARVPKRLPHKLAKLRLPELLKKDLRGYEPRNAQTINKNLNLLAGVLTKADKDGHFDAVPGWSNPFYVTFDISTLEKDHYEPFSVDELNKLFASPVFVEGKRQLGGKGEAAFWFPMIALYAGARRTEIAQLRLGDIRAGAGIPFIDFNDEGDDQNLTTTTSARSVPIHRDLITAGFLDYVTERTKKAKAEDPLWAGFTSPIGPKAKLWSKWFGRYLGEYVVNSPSKTFHSFRHTFKRACREAGITEEIHHAFTGHAGGGVGRSYGRMRRSDGVMDRGISLERLKAEIDRSHL